MTRNLVVCLDGTGAQPRAKGDSNVIRVFGMLDLTDPAKQVAYYDPGVGTFAAPGAWTPLARAITRVGGSRVRHRPASEPGRGLHLADAGVAAG